MNIKYVEKYTGLKKTNIRYYEQEGLLSPERNIQNNYRNYSEEDVIVLNKIKLLRSLGVSIADIRRLQKGDILLSNLMEKRNRELAFEINQLKELAEVCKKIKLSCKNFEDLNVEMVNEYHPLLVKRSKYVISLDKIYLMENSRDMLIKFWVWCMLLYVPAYIAVEICGYDFPQIVSDVFFSIAIILSVTEIVLLWRVEYLKSHIQVG